MKFKKIEEEVIKEITKDTMKTKNYFKDLCDGRIMVNSRHILEIEDAINVFPDLEKELNKLSNKK